MEETGVTIKAFSIEEAEGDDVKLVQLTLALLGSGQDPKWPRGVEKRFYLALSADQASDLGKALSEAAILLRSSVH